MTSIAGSIDSTRRVLSAVTSADDMTDEQVLTRYARGAWSCLLEPGDGIAGKLIATKGPVSALRVVEAGIPEHAVASASGMTQKELSDAIARWRPRLTRATVEAAFADAARANARLVTPDDEVWPAGLRDLGEHSPVCLWVRGDITTLRLPHRSLAIVGARASSGYGEHVAIDIAAELAGRGVTIVSGAAYGIDGAAHRAAVLAGGTTVALLAGGVDRAYPVGHTQLFDQILAAGGVASEVPCGSVPTKWRFLQRNRLIAAVAGATVVVEAGWRSGSLSTAHHAAALGRPLGAVPGPVTSATSAGCHRLLRETDARCITGPEDAMELLGIDRQPTLFDDLDAIPRTDDTTRIADALTSRSWRDVDDIARRSGMAVADVRAHLGMMQLAGDAENDGAAWRRLTARPAR